MNNEVEFAYRVRQALSEGAERLDYRTVVRLEKARQAALARQKTALAPSWAPTTLAAAGAAVRMPAEESESRFWFWMHRLGVVAPIVVLFVGFVAVYQWRNEQRIDELAAIDLALLLDDQPLDTYADRGFGTLLNHEQGL